MPLKCCWADPKRPFGCCLVLMLWYCWSHSISGSLHVTMPCCADRWSEGTSYHSFGLHPLGRKAVLPSVLKNDTENRYFNVYKQPSAFKDPNIRWSSLGQRMVWVKDTSNLFLPSDARTLSRDQVYGLSSSVGRAQTQVFSISPITMSLQSLLDYAEQHPQVCLFTSS